MKKNFSKMKWIIFPLLVLGFGAGILYVSVTIFQWTGSYPTLIFLLVCFGISLIFVLHTGNHQNHHAKTAAFVFECGGVIALGITLLCSVVVLREFSGATQTIVANNELELAKQHEMTKQINELAKLKSRSAQSKIASGVITRSQQSNVTITLTDVYNKAEKFLFWPLVGEFVWYLAGLLIVFGIVSFAETEDELRSTPIVSPRNTTRLQFNARNAPLRISSAHQVSRGDYFMGLSQQGGGFSIRWRKRGEQAQHVIRVTNDVAEKNRLETLDYVALAQWSLKTLRENGKESKPIYSKIEESLK